MNDYSRAFSEVNCVINNMPRELSKKIPDSFKQLILLERNSLYIPEISKIIVEECMLPETKVILGLIYRDFLCDETERKELQEKDLQYYKKMLEDEKNNSVIHQNNTQNSLITVNKKWYERVIEFFRNLIKY